MPFLPSLRRLAATWKVPFILVGSPPLRETSALFTSPGNAALSPSLIERQMRSPVPSVLHRRVNGEQVTHSMQKDLKRRGFDAIIRWCAYHQINEGKRITVDGSSNEDAMRMNIAVLHWVNESRDSFSCGQNLVVLTFLCDVLQRQHSQQQHSQAVSAHAKNATPTLSPADLTHLTDHLTHTIALLITRAVTSEQLELQPFLILLGAVYGLFRITENNPLHLSPIVLDSLVPPSALWLALLHQLRAFYSVGGDTGKSLDVSVNTEALLTVLLLFDESRCSMFCAPNDYKMLDELTRRLVRLLQPALAASRAARAREAAEDEESVADMKKKDVKASVVGQQREDDLEERVDFEARGEANRRTGSLQNTSDEALVVVEGDDNKLAASLSRPPDCAAFAAVYNRISISDCSRILARVRTSSSKCLMDLMEYFLCVVRDPAAMTRAEIDQLPIFFSAPGLIWDVQRSELARYVVRKRGITELKLLAPLLPFMRKDASLVEEIEEQLSKEAACASTIDPKTATCLLAAIGQQLSWTSSKYLLRSALTLSPDVLHAVDAALEDNESPNNASAATDQAKVLLSPDLCILLRFLFLYKLNNIPFPLPRDLDAVRYASHSEVIAIAGAVVRSIDWPHCAPNQLVQKSSNDPNYCRLSSYAVALGVLTAYIQSHDTFHFLTKKDEIEDRTLLNTLVLPLLRDPNPNNRRHTSMLLRAVLPHLKAVEYQRQLLKRLIQHAESFSRTNLFYFVNFFVVPATELKVFHEATLSYLVTQRTLIPRNPPRWVQEEMNVSKAYTTYLVRVVRYVLAAGVLTGGKDGTNSSGDSVGADPATWRTTLASWFGHYFSTLSSEARKDDMLVEQTGALVENETVDNALDDPAPEVDVSETLKQSKDAVLYAEEEDESEQVSKQKSADIKENQKKDGAVDGEHDDDNAAAESATLPQRQLLDEAFTAPVTENDFEAVLTLMLQTGTKASPRALALIAQRLRSKAFVARSMHELPALQLDEDGPAATVPAATTIPAMIEEEDTSSTTTVAMQQLSWSDDAKSETRELGNTASQASLQCLPLPAHFVFAVRADSALAIPITAPYLTMLLTTCEFTIFHYVLSSFFVALKRRRATAVLEQDMQIAAIAMDILQMRLAAYQTEHERKRQNNVGDAATEMLSEIAFKSLVHLLFHFSQLPAHTLHLRSFVESLHHPACGAIKKVTAAAKRGNESNGKLHADTGDSDDEAWRNLQAAHAAAAPSVLQVSAFIAASQLKEFTLAHLQRLALFFPDAAAFVFLQVQPHLGSFTQRELLQAATQYPAGAAVVLAELRKVDMRTSIDLGEFVPMAKRLPMCISEAIIQAHAPFLTIVWVTRVLSALAVRHEEMPLPLLHALLSRVEAVADTATKSDKSLLLLILQGYLLFGVQSYASGVGISATTTAETTLGGPATDADEASNGLKGRKGYAGDKCGEQTWTEDLLLHFTSSTMRQNCSSLTSKEQRQRVDLIRHCCDQLLSLERISTLEELRYFLVSYPPSLHQLRERGVVETVEQKLLPEMLMGSPVRWAELDALVSLLAEHRVLLPQTVQQISDVLFTPAQLELLQHASLVNLQCDSAAVLTGCLRIAITCTEAVRARQDVSPSSSGPFPLLSTVDAVLGVFDVTQDWLAALTTLVFPQSRVSPSTNAASSSNIYPAAPAPGSSSTSFPTAQLVVARYLCALLLRETDDLNPSEFARLVQSVSRLRAWDLAVPKVTCTPSGSARGKEDAGKAVDFPRVFCAMLERADAHSRCVLLKAITADTTVFHRFEDVVLRGLLNDVALLSPEDLETVLAATLQVRDETMVEPLLDAVGTRLLPIMDQCRRSTIVRLLQCHAAFHVDDKAVMLAALGAIDRQSPVEVKLDAVQVIVVLQAIAQLPIADTPERLVVLCFQRLEKVVSSLSPTQLYEVGRLILELEMGYIPCIHTLVTYILESRDGPRGHDGFQKMAEALCDVYDVEVAAQLRIPRLRKRRQKERIEDYYAAQRKVLQGEA